MKKLIFLLSCVFVQSTVNAQFTKLFDFSGVANGGGPYGSLLSDGTFLYGMTGGGGTYGKGTVFKIKNDGTGYVKLLDFSGSANGYYPWGNLISDGTFLYGTTELGGTNNDGVIFKIMPDGTNFSKLYDFSGSPDGKWPLCSLIFDGTYLYGTASQGGSNNMGTIFKIKTDGTGYAQLFDFTGPTNGMNPMSSLIFNDTAIYGMTRNGGAYGPYGHGVIFKIMPDGSGFSDLYDFPGGLGGASPDGFLITDGTFFYGMTSQGGVNGNGNIFKIMPDGSSYSDLFDFSVSDGISPLGSLASDGTHFYGMTYLGGAYNEGTLFSIMPDGTGYSVLADFSGAANGRFSYNTPMFDGTTLFGLVYQGGVNDMGVLFTYQPAVATGIPSTVSQNTTQLFPNPSSGQVSLSFDHSLDHATLLLFNTTGQKVMEKTNVSGKQLALDISEFVDGIYFIEVNDRGTISRIKVVKD